MTKTEIVEILEEVLRDGVKVKREWHITQYDWLRLEKLYRELKEEAEDEA